MVVVSLASDMILLQDLVPAVPDNIRISHGTGMVLPKDDRGRIIARVILQDLVIEQVLAGNIVIFLRSVVFGEQECGCDLLKSSIHPGLFFIRAALVRNSLDEQSASVMLHCRIDRFQS